MLNSEYCAMNLNKKIQKYNYIYIIYMQICVFNSNMGNTIFYNVLVTRYSYCKISHFIYKIIYAFGFIIIYPGLYLCLQINEPI